MAQDYRNPSNRPESWRGGRYQTGGERDRYRTGGEQRFNPERNESDRYGRGFQGDRSYSQGGYSEEFGYQRGRNRDDYDDRAFAGRNHRTRGASGSNYQSGRSYGGEYDREGQSRYDEGRFDEGNRWSEASGNRYEGNRDLDDTEFTLSRDRGTSTSRWREDLGEGGGYFDTGNYIDDGGASRGFGRDFERARARVQQENDFGGYRNQGRGTSGDYRNFDSDYGAQANYGRGQDAGAPWGQRSSYESRSSWDYEPSRSTQSFRGRGPQGYRRSDERLKEMICERLTDDPMIDASDITVEVKDQTVKITGTVDDRSTKYEIEELVERCGGVKDIDNQLRVQSSRWGSSQSSGTQTGQQARGGSDWEAGSSSTSASSTSGRSETSGRSDTRTSGTTTQGSTGKRN